MLIYSADEDMGAGRLLRSTASAGPVPGRAGSGPARLPAGNTTGDRTRVATILVRQLQPVIAAVGEAGGQIIEGPSECPTAAGSWPATRTAPSSDTSSAHRRRGVTGSCG
jgi:hypothetical protein